MTIWRWNESPATLETLMSEARLEKLTPLTAPDNSSWQVIVMPHQDDGLPLFLSAIVCLFGPCMGSDKGAT